MAHLRRVLRHDFTGRALVIPPVLGGEALEVLPRARRAS
jgi:hypothetical protein